MAWMIVGIGCSLLLAGLCVLIQPYLGSAAALAIIGFIVLATGGGLFLRLQRAKPG